MIKLKIHEWKQHNRCISYYSVAIQITSGYVNDGDWKMQIKHNFATSTDCHVNL